MANAARRLVLALPNGRILGEVVPMLKRVGIEPEPAFFDGKARQLRFTTNRPEIDLVTTRAFDVATIVAFGAAEIGVAGSDVLMEFNYDEIYAPVDLGVARCRLAVAAPEEFAAEPLQRLSHLRVATKYPRITRRHFARQGIQAECIKLSGAVELAPAMGLCRRIVDLVSTGATLRANRLVEIEQIAEVTARLIVNRAAFKTRHAEIAPWLTRIEEAARGA